MENDLIWDIRFYIYQQFSTNTRPPTIDETARRFDIGLEEVERAYEVLHHRDAIFLDPGTHEIRMAFPFSAVPTPFRVFSQGKTYWANCGWDAFGIPAALHADAAIEAASAEDGSPMTFAVQGERVAHQGERVHFLVPFRRWYDNLRYT